MSFPNTDNKIKLIIYYPKFNTANLLIFNFSISHYSMTKVAYEF